VTRSARFATAAVAALAVAGSLLTPAAAATAAPKRPVAVSSEDGGRYLVRYSAGTDIAAVARGLRSQGVAVRRTFSHAVRAAVVEATPAQAGALARSGRALSVEVDRRVQASGTQSDAPWGLDRIDQRALPLTTTFTAAGDGAGVEAYIVDTGVLAGHSDFSGRVAAGWSAIADGRGTSDCDGHGTHVAGTVAGARHGVAKAATIIPVRVLDCNGSGYMSDVVAGLDWVASRHAAGVPAVVNLSLGGGTSSTVDAALNGVIDDGVVAAVAAGNSATDACTTSPARVPAALTVAATDAADRQASFSNTGTCVDLYAPGVSVESAWYTSTTATAKLSGTSMAAPHVAGAAAVLLSQQPGLTPAQVAAKLADDATAGAVVGASTGTVNRLLFLAAGDPPQVAPQPDVTPEPVATVPDAPTGVTAAAGKRSATVTWVQGGDGGSALTGQTLSVYQGSKRVGTVSVSAGATAVKIGGLRAGKPYAFTVLAKNAIGPSPESARSGNVVPTR
jgi:subtilisin family serine protease